MSVDLKYWSLLKIRRNDENVENSSKDRLWSGVPVNEEYLQGQNALGVSIAKLRKVLAKDQQFACEVEPPMIADCHLLGEVVTPIKPTKNHPRNLVLKTAKLPLEHQVGSDDR